jgi:hypothetical protein
MWFDAFQTEKDKPMAGKSRMRPSFKKNTRRYREMIAPANTLEGQKKLTKKRRYANRHG